VRDPQGPELGDEDDLADGWAADHVRTLDGGAFTSLSKDEGVLKGPAARLHVVLPIQTGGHTMRDREYKSVNKDW
jgi:hypothetical protein